MSSLFPADARPSFFVGSLEESKSVREGCSRGRFPLDKGTAALATGRALDTHGLDREEPLPGRSSGLLRLNGRRAGGASRCAIHNCCDLPEHLAAARPLQFRPSIHGEADSDR